MLRLITLLFVLITIKTNSFAQSIIALESNGISTFYTNIDSALYHAQNGDFIYLPGGGFTPGNGVLKINKSVNIIGAGHRADSSLATAQTIINGSIRILSSASGGSIQGLYINGNIWFGNDATDMEVNNYSINRNYINGFCYFSINTSTPNPNATNIYFSENVLNEILFIAQAKNVLLSKNIFVSYIVSANGQLTFKNNIFLYYAQGGCYSTPTLHDINGANFYDNIFNNIGCSGIYTGTFSGNAFYNNMFSGSLGFPLNGNPGLNNIINQPMDSIFISHSVNTYKEINNYQLRNTCLGKNAGSDGTDIGLFGTNTPYKAGAIPMNPHIYKKSIASETDSQGNLNVNIKVQAQDR